MGILPRGRKPSCVTNNLCAWTGPTSCCVLVCGSLSVPASQDVLAEANQTKYLWPPTQVSGVSMQTGPRSMIIGIGALCRFQMGKVATFVATDWSIAIVSMATVLSIATTSMHAHINRSDIEQLRRDLALALLWCICTLLSCCVRLFGVQQALQAVRVPISRHLSSQPPHRSEVSYLHSTADDQNPQNVGALPGHRWYPGLAAGLAWKETALVSRDQQV